MRFEFSTATRIIFGEGTIAEAVTTAAGYGDRALVVTGHRQERVEDFLSQLKRHGVNYHCFSIPGEPTVEMIRQGCKEAGRSGCELVIAIGGGSVIDAGKAIAACLTNTEEIYTYLEVVGQGQPLIHPPATFIAIPTTAGTGAEVTANAVLQSTPHSVKVSLRSPLMLPKVAVVDPRLSRDMPPDLTAATGMDALTQLIEAFVSPMSNPMTDAICREGIRRASRSLLAAYEAGENMAARTDMALVALFSGMALANAKLGAVHGIAGPLGGMINIPHGVICARLLPLVMKVNLKALKTRQPQAPALKRFQEVAGLLTGHCDESPQNGVAWLEESCRRMKIPSLSKFGVTPDLIPELIPKAQRASSMKGNPIELTMDELNGIMASAC